MFPGIIPRMTFLLEAASHAPSAVPITSALVAALLLFGALGAVRLFGSSRPHS